MTDFAECSGNHLPLTPAQICNGFAKCGGEGIPMNSAGFNAVMRWIIDNAGAPAFTDCNGNPIPADAVLATCANLSQAIDAAVAAIPFAALADLLTGSASAGNIVTDKVLRDALGTGQDRKIDIARNGNVIKVQSTDGTAHAVYVIGGAGGLNVVRAESFGGHAVSGVVMAGNGGHALTGTVVSGGGCAVRGEQLSPAGGFGGQFVVTGPSGDGVRGEVYNAGSGDAVSGMIVGTGGGHGIRGQIAAGGNGNAGYFTVGPNANANGTGCAVYALNGANGTRNAVGQFMLSGTNTAWGVYTNGPIYTAGGVTTSDRRLKRDITAIDGARAATFSRLVRFYTYDKLIDGRTIKEVEQRLREDGARELAELETVDTASEGFDAKAHKAAIAGAKKKRAITLEVSDDKLSIWRQAGVIAQELQELCAEFPEFAFLVKPADPADPDPILVVDYQSLDAIMNAGMQARLEAAGI